MKTMKVIKRSQITKVVVERLVFHEVMLNGIKYGRLESGKVEVPHMNCNFINSDPKIDWTMYLNENTIQDLNKKQVKILKLDELFEGMDMDSLNGNM